MMPRQKPPLPGVVLWLEGLALACFAAYRGQGWLLPVAGIFLLLAATVSRGLWVALVAAVAVNVLWIFHGRILPVPASPLPASFAIVAILSGIACAFSVILSRLRSSRDPLAERAGSLAVIVHFAIAGVFLADHRTLVSAPQLIGWAAASVSIVLIGDIALALLSLIYTPVDQRAVRRAPGAFLFYRWLGPEWRACLPVRVSTDEEDLLKLSEMWMWPTIRRWLPALVSVALLVGWAATSVHEIGPGQKGVLVRLGAFSKEPLEPGLHLSLPWPLGGVRTVETGALHQVVLGFGADTGKPILWERPHYVDEELSLVGGGDDFLSISVPILYRISDPRAYLLAAAAGDDLIRNLAKRSLLRLTLNRTAADIMTTSREALRVTLQQELQEELDRRNSGLQVCDVYLRDIHPPVAVAPDFQEVVSAIEEKEALIHGGEEYRLDRLPGAKGDARQVVVNAEAAASDRLLVAQGEATRFASQSRARAASPHLYDYREGFRNFDLTLAGAKKAIFDDKMRGEMPAHLDLRRVLNPKLIDTAPPASEPLIQDPQRPAESFNLNVEGYH